MVMNVLSSRILGAEVHGEQCGKLAGEFFVRICRDEEINKKSATVLHSDNGAPMRSFAFAATMAELGISLSFSRPMVSNYNAFADSIFRTIKYCHS
jgi:transposase InsO family protein